MMFSFLKPLMYLGMILSVGYGGYYLMNMKAVLEVERQNSKTLQEAIQKQQAVLVIQQQDIKKIAEANTQMVEAIEVGNKRIADLDTKFTQSKNGKPRDVSTLARAKPGLVEKAINKGTVNAIRCLEISSGSPLTNEEVAVTKLSEANRECAHIHPNLNR